MPLEQRQFFHQQAPSKMMLNEHMRVESLPFLPAIKVWKMINYYFVYYWIRKNSKGRWDYGRCKGKPFHRLMPNRNQQRREQGQVETTRSPPPHAKEKKGKNEWKNRHKCTSKQPKAASYPADTITNSGWYWIICFK